MSQWGTRPSPFSSAEVTFLQLIGDHSYTDGQLIIGNTSTGGVNFATLIAGSGVTITNAGGSITIASSGSSGLTVGTTTIASGTTTRVLYDNAGVLGEYTISGSGSVAMTTSPTFTTPTLGAATATTINKVTITGPATGSTLTIADGKTLTASNSLTLAGTDATTITFQGTDTYVGRATTDTFTNKTYDTAGTGNVLKINGTQVSAVTGTGSVVLATSPTLTTPTIGVATATTINKVTITTPATGSTLTIADGKTLTANNSITLAGTDSTTMTFPAATDTMAGLGTAQTFTKQNVFNIATTVASAAGAALDDLKVQAATTTITGTTTITKLGKVSLYQPTLTDASAVTVTDAATLYIDNAPAAAGSVTITNAWALLVSAGNAKFAGHVSLEGVLSAGATGTGNIVFATSPSLTTPTITSGKFVTALNDTNGNPLITPTATASAVNGFTMTNNSTGNAPSLSVGGSGSDANVEFQLAAKGTKAIHYKSGTFPDLTADTDGATVTFDLSVSNTHTVTLGGNRTLALSNVNAGQCFILNLVQDATGSRTVTWFTTIKWPGGTVPTLTTGANKTDSFGFQATDSTHFLGYIIGQNL